MWRNRLLLLLFILIFLGVTVRLFELEILNPFRSFSDPYLKTQKIYPERGRIFDRNANPLVLNQNSYQLYVEPQKINDLSLVEHELAQALHEDDASIAARIDPSKVWVAIQSGIEENTKKAIEALNLNGVGFNYQMKRYYPEASLSAHLLGFVGKDSAGDNVGYFGLEGFYDKDLKGLPGFVETERDVLGRPILIGTQKRLNPENGRDLQLTIDKSVQEIIKRNLKHALDTYKAKSGCVITVNPMTMEVLGLVCLPDYDNSQYYNYTESDFRDPAISQLYEPGSVFKPLIMAAAIQEHKVKPDDIYNEQGPVEIGQYRIQTWDNKYEGKITMTRILEKSSNVGMVYVGQKLGNDNLYAYLQKYGFGQQTGIDLQGEASGYVQPQSKWYPIDYATVTFGQGIAVTPIQMIRAFASLVNGGKLMRPMVVKKIISPNDSNIIKPTVYRSVISGLTSKTIIKMLVSAVEHGEVNWARPAGYTFGGKTGTAQIPIQGHYDPSKTIASFIGFAPAYNPKFMTLVVLQEPQTSIWGSETAAPVFFDIAKELIVYYNIVPDQ